jgi:tRNA wybutosine-synthesizing protein 1
MSISSVPARLTLLALLSASTFYCLYKSRRLRYLKLSLNPNPNPSLSKPKLFFVSQTGTSRALADRLFDLLASNGLPFDLVDLKDYEPEDLPKETLVLIVASTWEDGKPPQNAKFFSNWLSESAEDFRVGSLLLSRCKFSVFGVGSQAYGATFNAVARDFSRRMRALGAKEILPVWEGDVDSGDIDEVFGAWSAKVVGVLKGDVVENGGVLCSEVGGESDAESVGGSDEDEGSEDGGTGSEIVDVEDIAGKGPSRKMVTVAETNGRLNGKKEMVTPVIRASLEKQVCLVVLGA